jgi:pimeloyl-ACP methyl ester carboxylesterase
LTGLSTYQHRRKISDWPKDSAALADHLGIARFAVLGVSGGGPYAAACAYALPERVIALGLASSAAPPAAFKGKFEWSPLYTSLWAWRHIPFFAHAWFSALDAWATRTDPKMTAWHFQQRDHGITSRPAKNLSDFVKGIVKAIRQAMDDQENIHLAPLDRAMIIEPYGQGGRGVARESWLAVRPWGFAPEHITVPARLWHGKRDVIAPVTSGRYLASRIPNCQAIYYPSERHGVLTAHPREIFTALLAAACVNSTENASEETPVAD